MSAQATALALRVLRPFTRNFYLCRVTDRPSDFIVIITSGRLRGSVTREREGEREQRFSFSARRCVFRVIRANMTRAVSERERKTKNDGE